MNWFTFALALAGTILGVGNLVFTVYRWRKERARVDLSVQILRPGHPGMTPEQSVDVIVTNYGKATARNVEIRSVMPGSLGPADGPTWPPTTASIPTDQSVTFSESLSLVYPRIAVVWTEDNRRGRQIRLAPTVNFSTTLTPTGSPFTVQLEPGLPEWRQRIVRRVGRGRVQITH